MDTEGERERQRTGQSDGTTVLGHDGWARPGRRPLEALRVQRPADGVRWLVVGADDVDWPLGWYRRLGFGEFFRTSRRTGSPDGLGAP